MSMNPRLLRPRQTTHPEAANWAARVLANGGSVSGSTLSAVSKFCRSIDTAGIRSLFFRANLFCGTGLNACLVPLYRGPSKSGTQYGNTTDTNVGPFVSGDYVESSGLSARSGGRLLTGLLQTDIGVSGCHLACYERVKATGTYNSRMGSRGATSNNEHLLTGTDASTKIAYGSSATGGNGRASISDYNEAGAFFLGVNTSSTSSVLYKNGASVATGTPSERTPQSVEYYVFGLNNNGSATDGMTTGVLSAYSIGAGMTGPQASAYYTAMQAFQTSMARSV